MRLEFVGDAETLEVDYQTFTDDLGYRGAGAGTAFTLVSGDDTLSVPANLGPGTAHFALDQLDRSDPDQPLVVYLPEGMRPRVFALRIGGGELVPAAARATLARVRRLDRRGLDRERAVGRVACGRGAPDRTRRREPRVRGIGSR